jgi:hypothetical protein
MKKLKKDQEEYIHFYSVSEVLFDCLLIGGSFQFRVRTQLNQAIVEISREHGSRSPKFVVRNLAAISVRVTQESTIAINSAAIENFSMIGGLGSSG